MISDSESTSAGGNVMVSQSRNPAGPRRLLHHRGCVVGWFVGGHDVDKPYLTSTWWAGCIFAEMASGQPLFTGDSEIDQLFRIFQKLGEDALIHCGATYEFIHP